jgi:hypothetical protein
MMKFLWLDDMRDPKEKIWADYITKNILEPHFVDIAWVKNYAEFTAWITENGMPGFISFDHDLADEHYTPEKYWSNYEASKAYQDAQNYQEKTGMDCAKWLADYCMDNNTILPKFYVHSANPVGADNIRRFLNNFLKSIKPTIIDDLMALGYDGADIHRLHQFYGIRATVFGPDHTMDGMQERSDRYYKMTKLVDGGEKFYLDQAIAFGKIGLSHGEVTFKTKPDVKEHVK